MNDISASYAKEYISDGAYEKLMDHLCQTARDPLATYAIKQLLDSDYTFPYDDLYQLLAYVGISVKEFFQIIGVEPEWPDKSFYTLQKTLEALEKNDYSSFCKTQAFARFLRPAIWDTDFYGSLPSKRIAALVQNKLDYLERQSFKNTHTSILHLKTIIPDIPTESLVGLANELGVSFKWVLCIPDDMPVISKSAKVEEILQDYAFMDDDAKEFFLAALKTSKKEG